MATYVPAGQQLVVEILVRDAARSSAFYQQLGFDVAEDRGTFVVLTWEGHELFLDQRSDLPVPPPAPPAVPQVNVHVVEQGGSSFTRRVHVATTMPQANVRVMVADVDACWRRAQAMAARVLAPIGDRAYGLRDFTILDPDGFGLRFGSLLSDRGHDTSGPNSALE